MLQLISPYMITTIMGPPRLSVSFMPVQDKHGEKDSGHMPGVLESGRMGLPLDAIICATWARIYRCMCFVMKPGTWFSGGLIFIGLVIIA